MGHTSYSDLQLKLSNIDIKEGDIYYHWRDPNTKYKILSLGFTEWNEDVVVIYQNIETKVVWVRKLEGDDGWLTPVERDGEDKRRFIKIEI